MSNLKRGYGEEVIAQNTDTLIKAGKEYRVAIREALNAARKDFFAKHPHGYLPYYLALPDGGRNKDAWKKWADHG